MNFKKFGDWLITKSGRKFSFGVALTISSGIISLKTLPNTIFLDKYKEVVHLYKHGMTVPLSKLLKERFEKAMDLIEVKGAKRHLFEPFPVFGFDTFNGGTSYSRFGAIIGIPINFTYTDTDDIDKQSIRVNNESVVWELDEGKQLLESYILSENAQIYAIAREIKMAESAKFLFDSTFVIFGTTSCYALSNYINIHLNFYTKPRKLRLILYGLVICLTVGVYTFLKDSTQIYFERKVDTFLKEKNPVFAQGGREYYEKMLQRNKALRKLLGKEGENMFSVLGNENSFFRQKHLPLLHRKEFFEAEELM